MRQIIAMTRKEFRQVFRDRPMVAIIFLVPIVQLLVLSFAITTEVKHVKLVIADQDGGTVSREVTDLFTHTDRFDPVGATGDYAEIEALMRGWEAEVALVIPPEFEKDLLRGSRPAAAVIVDGVNGNAASVAAGYASGILAEYAAAVAGGGFSGPAPPAGPALRAGGGEPGAPPVHAGPPVSMQERMWYNPDLDTKQHMVPAIVVVLLTILPMMLSGMSLVKEKEIGTLEQLQVTPLGKHSLLMGKLAPFLILSFIELAIVTTVGVLVFGVRMNGSYLDLALASLIYLATTIGLGIFISTVTATQQQAMFFAWFVMVFMILMSGFFIPIENMPPALQAVTYINPMRYFMSLVRDLFQKGSGLSFLWRDLVPMGVYGLLIFSLGVASFRKRIA